MNDCDRRGKIALLDPVDTSLLGDATGYPQPGGKGTSI